MPAPLPLGDGWGRAGDWGNVMDSHVRMVRITCDGYDLNLEKVLETTLVSEGFELSSLGFDLTLGERHLVFQEMDDPVTEEEEHAEQFVREMERAGRRVHVETGPGSRPFSG